MIKKTKNTIEDLIYEKLCEGKTYREISVELHVSPNRISRVSFAKKQDNRSPLPLKIGRPIKITNNIVQYVNDKTLESPILSSAIISQNILSIYGMNISRRSIDKVRHKIGFIYTNPRKRQVLTQVQIQKRIEFCTKQLENSIDWNNDVIVTDESRFSLSPDNSKRWIKRGIYNEGSFLEQAKFNKSIMVWARIGYNFRTKLLFIEKSLDSDGYIKLLENNNIIEEIKAKYDPSKIHFQQDGAPCHTSARTIKWLKERIKIIEDWPPNSPDLTPIENMWPILKGKVNDRKEKDWKQMKQIITEEYQSIDQNVINNLIKSITDRFRLCLENGGHSIARIIQKHHQYDNEISEVENMESEGIFSPKDVNEECIEKYINVGGIITRKSKIDGTIIIRVFYHPHIVKNSEMPHYLDVNIEDEIEDEFKLGSFYIFYGKYQAAEANRVPAEYVLKYIKTYRGMNNLKVHSMWLKCFVKPHRILTKIQ